MFIGSGLVSSFGGAGGSVSAADLRGWIPTASNGLSLWLDAQDASTIQEASSAVSQWSDKSGFAHHATQAVEASRPVCNTSGFAGSGLPYLRFSSDELQIADSAFLDLSGGFNLFIVIANNAVSATTDSRIFSQWATGNLSVFSSFNNDTNTLALGIHDGSSAQFRSASGIIRDTPYIAEIRHDGGVSGAASVNQLSAGAAYTIGVNNSSAPFLIGSASAPITDNVDIAEIILYQRALSADEAALVYVYLNAKWQI